MGIDGNTLRELAIKVSQYFLDFLESDFKRQQAPRRRIILQTEAGFRAGMKVAAYPGLQHNLWQILGKRGDDLALKIQPRNYTRPISATLKGVIREQVQIIADETLSVVLDEVANQAQATRGRAVENPEDWVDSLRATLARETGTQIVRPLLAMLDGPLSNQAYSVKDSIFSTEVELIELVIAKLDQVLPEILSRYLAHGNSEELVASLSAMMSPDDTRSSLGSYFESFVAADAYLEFRDLETYAAAGENLQLYLYIGALRYGNLSYPLFYVPVEVARSLDGVGYTINLVKHLFANKRAIDFVLQELGERQKREWLSPIKERITYLHGEQSLADAARPLFHQVASAMDLAGQIEFEAGKLSEASTTSVILSTALHLAVFDRSDEALLNDYEEMIAQARKNEPGVLELFQGIVKGVLLENPTSIHQAVETEWDSLPLVDRVVIDSPVPLNEEQIKILSAIRNPEGKIIVVEGPPGTGKSHTITAIAADCALRGKSCLIVSDKAEALNVVQDKLSKAMNQARHDKAFPNPLLRLGQDQANFKRLTSNQTLTQVSAYVKAAKANQPKIQADLSNTRDTLKQNITETLESLGQLSLADIERVHSREMELAGLAAHLIPKLQAIADASLLPSLREADDASAALHEYLVDAFTTLSKTSDPDLIRRVRIDAAAVALGAAVDEKAFGFFNRIDVDGLRFLSSRLLEFEQLRMPIFGYLFRESQLRSLEGKIQDQLSPIQPIILKRDCAALKKLLESANRIRISLSKHLLMERDMPDVYEVIADGRVRGRIASIACRLVEEISRACGGELPVSLTNGATPIHLAKTWILTTQYLAGWIKTGETFARAPEYDYVGTKSRLELLNVTTMNSEVDGRLVSFVTKSATDAKILASVISQRQKFPEDKFSSVKEAFPVTIASIREFGEYMPLAADIFDVLVIDEASQVSVAQAFPALLRARKIVVLGDSKQFSNTKSMNASIALNEKYRADLEAFFRQRISQEASMLQRISRFDVKCSVLEFCQLCANYTTMLRKHFRSNQELISFSSETFYGGQLQAIKIRGVSLDEVIKFDYVDATNVKSTKGTNEAEAEFILQRLIELMEEEDAPTVGVITPFRDQQTYLSKKLFGHAKGAEFQDKLRLKVMTFDSCQGEERQIIFYSMVATAKHDVLNFVFPVELKDAQDSVEEKLKVQRLNVGFSRAEEMIWFVLSKPIAEFRGSIGRALNHYNNLLLGGEVEADRTDPKSPMEMRVLDWLRKTPFYQQHRDDIEILPQFPIGNYLRQLDPTYQHPSWRVDFLVTVNTAKGTAHIVVEYDGFEHHFQKGKFVNAGNHERYLVEADVERQLTLESYGYRFLRINRFNLGKDPIQTLSDRLSHLVEQLFDENEIKSVENVQKIAEGLAKKVLKTCSKCGQIKPQEAYYDPSLKKGEGGFGRVCTKCKEEATQNLTERRLISGQGRRWRRRRWR
jgi:Mrp family chromosome partitioning ATPase/very-short-patch-repair endonuclease